MITTNKYSSSMERELKFGLMAQNTKETGEMVWPKVKEISTMLMETSTPVNFTKIGPMDLESTCIKMDKLMRAFGETTCKTDLAKRNSKTDQNTTECLKTEKNGDRALTNGQTSQFTQATGSTIILKAMENTDGLMAEFTKASGKRISSMEGASTLGLMEESMKEITRMIKSMEMERTPGPMANLTRDSGPTESSMVRLDSQTLRVGVKWASGRTARESNG